MQVLAGDVVNGNPANAYLPGQTLGNLAAGSSAAQLNKLVDKWFLGADHPATRLDYVVGLAGSLFVDGPAYNDWTRATWATATSSPRWERSPTSSAAAIQNMFIDNGDNTWTVRFYYNGTADYVTVDRMLPTSSRHASIYANYGAHSTSASTELWMALAEKAYAQWNETGKEGRDGQNSVPQHRRRMDADRLRPGAGQDRRIPMSRPTIQPSAG